MRFKQKGRSESWEADTTATHRPAQRESLSEPRQTHFQDPLQKQALFHTSRLPSAVQESSAEAAHTPPTLTAEQIMYLQKTIGNRALQRLVAGAVRQRVARASAESEAMPRGGDVAADAIRTAAAQGIQTPVTRLPFLDTLQPLFGRHDLSRVRAHVGPEATASASAMGARAYATGEHVVLAGTPDLRTTAHEAAHVVQQRAGVQLAGGVGQVGDTYEQHADAVAERVASGQSAEGLLERFAGGRGRTLTTGNTLGGGNPHPLSALQPAPLIQLKKILNLASGTNIEKLMKPAREEDEVMNVDRGDMLFAKVILDNYELFFAEIDKDIRDKGLQKAIESAAQSRASKFDVAGGEQQLRKEMVNAWMYKILEGDMGVVKSKIKERETAGTQLASAEGELGATGQFDFGAVSGKEKMPYADGAFDEIHMMSGYGIQIIEKPELTKEIARVLKVGGLLVLTGNVPVLKNIGFKVKGSLDASGGMRIDLPAEAGKLFEVIDWKVEGEEVSSKSEHTLGGGFGKDQFHTLVCKRKS